MLYLVFADAECDEDRARGLQRLQLHHEGLDNFVDSIMISMCNDQYKDMIYTYIHINECSISITLT